VARLTAEAGPGSAATYVIIAQIPTPAAVREPIMMTRVVLRIVASVSKMISPLQVPRFRSCNVPWWRHAVNQPDVWLGRSRCETQNCERNDSAELYCLITAGRGRCIGPGQEVLWPVVTGRARLACD